MSFEIIIFTLLVEVALGLLRAYKVRVTSYQLVHKANRSWCLVPYTFQIDYFSERNANSGPKVDVIGIGPKGSKVYIREIPGNGEII